jgi:hypothetical protein
VVEGASSEEVLAVLALGEGTVIGLDAGAATRAGSISARTGRLNPTHKTNAIAIREIDRQFKKG